MEDDQRDIAPEYWLLKGRIPDLPLSGTFIVSSRALASLPCGPFDEEAIRKACADVTFRSDEDEF